MARHARPSRRPRHPLGWLTAELALGGVVAMANVGLYRVVPKAAQLPVSLVGAAALAAGGRAAGASWADLGLGRAAFGRGVRTGLAGSVPVAVAIGAAAALPATQQHFHDERVRRVDGLQALHEVGVLIPFQTALPEEVLFRGIVLGLLLPRRSPAAAVAASSALFGLWHVLPTLGTMGHNSTTATLAERPLHRAAVVAAAVGVTAAAGVGFSLLRLRSGSVVAPAITHAVTNGLAFAAAYAVTRCAAPRAEPAGTEPATPP